MLLFNELFTNSTLTYGTRRLVLSVVRLRVGVSISSSALLPKGEKGAIMLCCLGVGSVVRVNMSGLELARVIPSPSGEG